MSAYWKGWPMSKCPYNEDLNWAYEVAIRYLRKISPEYKTNGRTGVVVFDLDDTLFMGDPESVIGVTEGSLGMHPNPKKNNTEQEVFYLPPIKQMKQVVLEAKKLGFKIMCITARPPVSHLASEYNLYLLDIPYDWLIMNDKEKNPVFKVEIRKDLMSKPNCDIVCTIGDQFTDLFLPGGNTCVIKLPEPDLKCTYAFVPK